MFRTFKDIVDSWGSLEATVKYMGDQSKKLSNYTGPGAWNDPDQVRRYKFTMEDIVKSRIALELFCELPGLENLVLEEIIIK